MQTLYLEPRGDTFSTIFEKPKKLYAIKEWEKSVRQILPRDQKNIKKIKFLTSDFFQKSRKSQQQKNQQHGKNNNNNNTQQH